MSKSSLLPFPLFLIFLTPLPTLDCRSIHRPRDPYDPRINVYWEHNQTPRYEFCESHLPDALFNLFDKDYFLSHLLPSEPITYRHEPQKSVMGATLSALIEDLITEIFQLQRRQKKISFKNFIILKKRDVNRRNHTGLYVVKFKDYPFVLKLFIETPQGIITPLQKGFEPIWFYYLAGLSRHFNGFTRIKNLENIKKIVQADPYWSEKVDFPRKWFWLPKNPQWIVIEGDNIGPHTKARTQIPAIYAFICDEIIWEKPFSLKNPHDREEAIALSNFLEHRIDAHINNFGIEIQSHKIVPIDFEHFVTSVGIEDTRECKSYVQWYAQLTLNSLKRLLFRNKKERREAQRRAFKGLT